MEKRRVRIYKAGGEQGSYINKTAKYFQEGGMQIEQEFNDNQLISIIMQRLSKDDNTANIQYAENDLAQLNIEPARIKKLSNYVLNYIEDQRSLQDAEQTGDEETAKKLQIEENANQQIAQEEELLAQQQLQQQQLQDIYSDDSASVDDGSYDQAESDIIMRNGGMPSKKAFINNYLKLVKKQEGGNTEEKLDIKTDILNGRVKKIKDFQNALTSTANNAALKQQAEDAYKGYAQNGGTQFPSQNEDPENPMHHIGAYATGINDIFDNPQVGTSSGPDELQFGGWGQGKERRAARRMNRMMPQGFNQMINPFMQQQMNPLAQFMPNQGNLGLANIDVRRTGLFGRPKEYTINFNTVTPITLKDIEDTKKQEINNADEIVKDAEQKVEEEKKNTSTEKNTEVLKASVVMPTAEDITIVTNKVKNSSGKNIPGANDTEVESKPEQQIIQSQGVIQNAINAANQYPNKTKTNKFIDSKGNTHIKVVASNGKVYNKIIPAKSFNVNNNQSLINPITKKPFNDVDSFSENYQQGGFVDPESGLYKFMSGGEDIEQFNLDYSNSKNISSPYFQSGGYFQTAGQTDETVVDILDKAGNVVRKGTLAEAERAGLNHRIATNTKETNKTVTDQNTANINYAQQYLQNQGLGINNPFSFISRGANWNKPVGRPYGTGTLNPISGMIGPNAQVSSINVRKSRLSGVPKKFTVNYNVPGQPGINTSGTPQSYIGSDGERHWMNNANQPSKNNQEVDRKRPVADMLLRSKIPGLQQLGSRMYPWENNNTSKSMSELHDKNDENYKKIYGHYPGEEQVSTKFIPPTQSQLENETYESIPESTPETDSGYQLDAEGMRAIPQYESPYGKLQTKPLDQFTSTSELMPNQSRVNPNYSIGQEPIPVEEGQEGPSTEDETIYNNAFEQQRQQDISGYGIGLLGIPNEQDLYRQSQGDLSAQDFQDFQLQRMYDKNQQYPELGNLESLDYTQLVNPQAIQEQNNNPIVQQNKNINQNIKKTKTSTTKNNDNSNWANVNMKNMTRQQKIDFQNKEGASYNKLQDLKKNVMGNNINEFKKSVQQIDSAGKKIFNRLTPTQKLNYLNRLKKIDKNLYDGYVSLLQEGGTAIPKAEYGEETQSNPFTGAGTGAPINYYKDPTTGVYKNLAQQIYAPKTNLQGTADKLMSNANLTMDKDYTNPLTGEAPGIKMGEEGKYQNEGILSDAEKQAGASQQVSQKFKNKQEWNIDAKGALDFGNIAGNALLGFAERAQDALQNRNIGSKFDASNIYAQTEKRDRGTYGQEGDFRPDETGFKGVVKYGGYMEEGGSYEEGGDTWMSEEQIQQFLAEGGELEFV